MSPARRAFRALFLPCWLGLASFACNSGAFDELAAFTSFQPTQLQSPSPAKGSSLPPSDLAGAVPTEVPQNPPSSCDFVTSGTFDQKPVAAALAAMASGRIVNIIPSRKSGRTVKVTLLVEPAWRVFFKPWHRVHLFTRPQGEAGAFRVNRMLGMNHVPPAVVRTLDGSVIHSAFKRRAPTERLEQLEREVLSLSSDEMPGALLLWADDGRVFEPSDALLEKMALPEARLSAREQVLVWDLTWMFVLDHLTNNYDRLTGGNILRRRDGRLLFIDNGAAFGPEQDWKAERRRGRLKYLTRHSPTVTLALRRLEARVMAACAGDVLSARDIDGVLSRRDELVAHFDRLARDCPVKCRLPLELEAP